MRNSDAMPVNLLVVDDRPESRIAIEAILASPDYRIVEAGSGPEALRRLLDQEFAVLLVDVVMPGMDGFELATAIKERERTATVPIIFLTAQATDIDQVYKGYRVGAVDYLIMPLVPEMVRAKVSVFAELYRQKKREAEHQQHQLQLIELQIAQERRYHTLAEAVPHIVWTARPDGSIDYFNQRWFEYSGLSLEEAAGSWEGVLHPEDLSRCRSEWEKTARSGQTFQSECRLRRSDGTFRWHLCRGLAERSNAGQVVSWLGTFTDIEDQKRVQAVLSEFKRTLDAEPDAVTIFEPKDGRIVYVNQGASAMLGYSRDEILRKHVADFIAGHDHDRLCDLMAPIVSGAETVVVFEARLPRRDPHAPPLEVSVQLIRIGDDRIVSIARDITERKRTQFERELLYREAVDAIHARDEFLSVASHELRTPLSALHLQIELILRLARRDLEVTVASEEVRPRVEMAARQIDRLSRLIGELMDASRITAGRLRLDLEEVDLSAVARDVTQRFAEEANRVHCAIELRAQGPVIGRWDRMRLEQVVTNLFTNAIKFGSGKSVEVAVEERGASGRLTVRDHGIGIAPEDVERIFQRYEQAASSRVYGGLGLGLYIVHQIVDAHGGTIRVESQPGTGSTFTVDLPREPTAAPGVEPGVERGAELGQNSS